MFIKQFTINIFVFLFSLFGISFYKTNILITLIFIELMLLSVNLNFLIFSTYLNDYSGQIMGLIILTIAASESAIGLALIISFFNIKSNIDVKNSSILRY
jgi:NADH-quinone oxidoreductase subunit K